MRFFILYGIVLASTQKQKGEHIGAGIGNYTNEEQKTELEKQIFETIIDEFNNTQYKEGIKRPNILKGIDKFNLSCSDDAEIISISKRALESYGKGERECSVSRFFILAILIDLDLNKLKDKISTVHGIKPLEK